MKGIAIFNNVEEAIRAGYMVIAPYPDSEGFLHAYIDTPAGLALALIRTGSERR